MGLIEVKTAKITERGQIAIPKDIRELEGFREGQKIAVLAFDDHVELRPLKSLSLKKQSFFKTPKSRAFRGKSGRITALLSEKALAKTWNTKEEDEAWKDL